jgi:iron complex outermembrane receptor protein
MRRKQKMPAAGRKQMAQFSNGNVGRNAILQVASVLALTAGAVATASAQDTADRPRATNQVEDVIVTARKREESALNIPVTVTALTEDTIERNSLTSIERVAALTPQLQVNRQPSGSGATLSMRGIGSTSTSSGIEQSVALIVDGVYYGSGRMLNEGMLDMRQIEILEGPQALFFGKNATGGVLSFTSNLPGDEFEAMGRVGYETTTAERTFEGMISAPLTESFGLRLAVRATDMDEGYIDNAGTAGTAAWFDAATFAPEFHDYPAPLPHYPGGESLTGRLTAHFEPTNNFNSTLRITHSESTTDNTTSNVVLTRCPVGGFPQGGGPMSIPCGEDWVSQDNDMPATVAAFNSHFYNRNGGRSYNDYTNTGATWSANLDVGNLSFSNVMNYYDLGNLFFGDADTTNAFQTYAAVESGKSAFSEEFRVQSLFESPLNFMLGIYYQTQEDSILNHSSLGVSNSALIGTPLEYLTYAGWGIRSETDGETLAGFAQLMWELTPTLELDVGARYTHETKDSFLRQFYVNPLLQGAGYVQYDPLNPAATELVANQRFNDLSPEVALTWTPTSELTLYAAYKEGFKSGGFSNSSLFGPGTVIGDIAFRPETVSGVEFGIKSLWFDRRFRLNAVVFSYEYEDMQIDFLDLGRAAFTTFNAGAVETQGVSFQMNWVPPVLEGLSIGANLNYIVAEYMSFPFAPCFPGQSIAEGCQFGVTPGNPNPRNFQNLTGRTPALAPEWTASLSADYVRPIGAEMEMGVHASVLYSDSYNTSAFGAEQYATQDAYATFDAGAYLSGNNDRWRVSLIGKNLTEEFVALGSALVGGAGTGTAVTTPPDLATFPNQPRTVEIQLTLRF